MKTGLAGINISTGKQYAIALKSDVSIIAPYGKLDVRQSNMVYHTTPGHME